MRCPWCSHDDDRVVDSRPAEHGSAIRRRRQCGSCGRRYTTFERVEEVGLMVLAGLKQLDQVAYMRFASVYKDFQQITDFEHELGLLLQKKEPAKRRVESS